MFNRVTLQISMYGWMRVFQRHMNRVVRILVVHGIRRAVHHTLELVLVHLDLDLHSQRIRKLVYVQMVEHGMQRAVLV